MPTYDYQCKRCEYKFELFQPITSKPKAECPKCSSDSKRLISAGGGIIFKGSGFYVNDYKRKSEPSSSSNNSSESKTTESEKK